MFTSYFTLVFLYFIYDVAYAEFIFRTDVRVVMICGRVIFEVSLYVKGATMGPFGSA
jgi:hypothetical protein